MSIQNEDIRFLINLGRGKCANKTSFSFLMYAHGHQIRKKLGVKGHQPLNHQ